MSLDGVYNFGLVEQYRINETRDSFVQILFPKQIGEHLLVIT